MRRNAAIAEQPHHQRKAKHWLSQTRVLAAILALITVGILPSVSQAAPIQPAASQAFTVYVSVAGSDANDGLTPQTAVSSLSAAHDVVWSHVPETDIEIRIQSGLYEAPTTVWNYYVPGKSVSFMPADYVIGDSLADIDARPVFRGTGANGGGRGFWMQASVPAGDPGGTTDYRFYFLEIQRYERGGLLFAGGAAADANNIMRPTNDGVNGNTVTGMIFREIGTTWVQGDSVMGYDGIGLSNSSNNLIEYNQFINLENFDDDASTANSTGGNHMHGVYLTNHSANNVLRFNQFDQISGDPVKAKNDSNDNLVDSNVSTNSGTVAFFHDWFCDFSTNCANRQAQECASHGNIISNNRIISSYGHGEIEDAALLIPGQDYPGGAGCDNEGQDRTVVFDNLNTTSDNAADLRLNSNFLPNGAVGQPYSFYLDSRGGHAPLSWSATGLPAGLTINSASGLISGTPTDSSGAPVPVTFEVTDMNGAIDTLTLQLHISAIPATVDSRSTAFGTWADGTNVAYVISHSFELTLNALDVITGELLDAVVLSNSIGTKSYSSHVSDSGLVYITTDREGLFVYDPVTSEVRNMPAIAGDINIAMVSSYGDQVMGVTATGVAFSFDENAAAGSEITEHGTFTGASASGSAVAVGPAEAYFGTHRGGSRVFARNHATGATHQIALPAGHESDVKVQDLTYRDGHLFVFTANSRELLVYDLDASEWVASTPLMGGSRISQVMNDRVYLISDATKSLMWFDLTSQEFVNSAMAANAVSYSRAYGIEVFEDAVTGEPFVIGAGSNANLWHYPVDTGPLRFYATQARSGEAQPEAVVITPAWERFDGHEIPAGSELSPTVASEPFSQTLRASGGDGDYQWSVRSGALPDGMSLSDTGVLDGVANSVGPHYVKVRATDSNGAYSEANLIMRVGGATLDEPTVPRPEVPDDGEGPGDEEPGAGGDNGDDGTDDGTDGDDTDADAGTGDGGTDGTGDTGGSLPQTGSNVQSLAVVSLALLLSGAVAAAGARRRGKTII